MSSNEQNRPSSTFAFVKQYVQQFSDDQQLERLQGCRDLEVLWRKCQQQQSHYCNKNDGNNMTEATASSLETNSTALRILRLFQWRDLSPSQYSFLPTQQQTSTVDACLRHEHVVWACRALATGCGPQLQELQNCFKQYQPQEILVPLSVDEDVSRSRVAYTDEASSLQSNTLSNVPCADLQRQMGQCVAKQLAALSERAQQRREKQ